MTNKDKQLLFEDLSARLSYGVVAQVSYKDGEGWKTENRKVPGIYTDGQVYVDCVYTNIENIKPYLRPLYSMTEEELEEFRSFHCVYDLHPYFYPMMCNMPNLTNMFDWLNKYHFDYRDLIERGLAIEAPDGMYDIK